MELLIISIVLLLAMPSAAAIAYLLTTHHTELTCLTEQVKGLQADVGFLASSLEQHTSQKLDSDRLADLERKLAGVMLKLR